MTEQHCSLPAIMITLGLSMWSTAHAQLIESRIVSNASRQTPCIFQQHTQDDEPDRDGVGLQMRACATVPEPIPVVRTPPVLVAPELQPTSPTRHVLKRGVSPEVLDFLRRLHGKILDSREYPINARKLGLQGTATVAFNLMPDGNAQAIRIRRTSGHSILDDAAINAVQRILPFKPPREAGTRPLELLVPIGFSLQ